MSGMPVANQTVQSGEDLGANVTRVSDSGTSTRITTATTTVVAAGRGNIKRLVFPTALTGAVTAYDNTAASGTVLVSYPIGSVGTQTLGIEYNVGCTILTAAADQVISVNGR